MFCSNRVLFSTAKHVVELDPRPFTPGTVYVNLKNPHVNAITVMDLSIDSFLELMLFVQSIAHKVCSSLKVQRCAMVGSVSFNEKPGVRIIPLHGLKSEWNAMLAGKPEFNETFTGYLSSNSGPQWEEEKLTELQQKIRKNLLESDNKEISNEFHGDASNTNLFAKLIRGEISQWRLWEDESHVSFLTPFPNAPGFTVVIPRKHLPSDIFSLEKNDYIALLKASHRVAQLLKEGIPNAKACGIIFEGFEIDYAHAKLIPIIGDHKEECSESDFCEEYQGYVSSKHGNQLSDEEFQEWIKKLKIDG